MKCRRNLKQLDTRILSFFFPTSDQDAVAAALAPAAPTLPVAVGVLVTPQTVVAPGTPTAVGTPVTSGYARCAERGNRCWLCGPTEFFVSFFGCANAKLLIGPTKSDDILAKTHRPHRHREVWPMSILLFQDKMCF